MMDISSGISSFPGSYFDWLYKDEEVQAAKVLGNVSLDLVLGALKEGYIFKAMDCFNLRHSLLEYFSDKGEDTMENRINQIVTDLKAKLDAKETSEIQSDNEYFLPSDSWYSIIFH